MKLKGYREKWEEANGPIPKGMHIHHILPRYMGGTDELDNLQLVTPEEHYDIHFERGEYSACALLSDGINREAPTQPVVQFDLDGYRVGRFESTVEAGRVMGTDGGNIRNCCRYANKSRLGYQWFYESEVGDIDYIGPVKRNARVKTFGHDTSRIPVIDVKTLLVYKSKRDASAGTGIPKAQNKNSIFTSRFVEITKEEYYYLQELIKL